MADENTKYGENHPMYNNDWKEKDELAFKSLVRKIPNEYRDFRHNLIRSKIEKIAFADGILIQVSDDDYYTLEEKKVMWKRQNGICPCDIDDCVKEIPLEEMKT